MSTAVAETRSRGATTTTASTPSRTARLWRAGCGGRPTPGTKLDIPARGDPDLVTALLQFGGFPEPFLAQSARTLRRWQKERLDRFFREDVRDLEPIRDLSTFELLADLLPERVGSLLSLNALREDLEVSHRAVTHWMDILETLYHVFRIRPFAGPRARTLTKMPKAYLWDCEPGAGPAAALREPGGARTC